MGLGFTAETPLKVSRYGIDSVIAIGDDMLLEKLRKVHCDKNNIAYVEITKDTDDYRSKRITAYLNLINQLCIKRFDSFKRSFIDLKAAIQPYFELLPNSSDLKLSYHKMLKEAKGKDAIKNWLEENLKMGSVDVNIMTKLDKVNYKKGKKLPIEFNDAHAALRGYALSDLTSSIVLSAGMNPRLYSYMENFDDFYPNEMGVIEKKIILKVSDFRSAMIQGRFLAKKGLWVSEYRVESGLNCGGHAFATDGYLLGPILEEFKNRKKELVDSTYNILLTALTNKHKVLPNSELPLKISVQGGVGTAEEHEFLINNYNIDSVGWGTPFLLVPEATTVDEDTLNKLVNATEVDLYRSDISPLGVSFNSLRNSTKTIEKLKLAKANKPGSPCIKKYLSLNTEFSDKGTCTASRKYQKLKIVELETLDLSIDEYRRRYEKIIEKECLCTGLGTSVLLVHDLDTQIEGKSVSVCPGPNLAYFSKVMSLEEAVGHIYGRNNVIDRADRPHMFIKELWAYIDYFNDSMDESKEMISEKKREYLVKFGKNMMSGIVYYENLFLSLSDELFGPKSKILESLKVGNSRVVHLLTQLEQQSISSE